MAQQQESSVIKKTFSYGEHQVTLETGRIAKQATSAVLVSMGDTVVLATLVAASETKQGIDFLPLTVVYQERTYAAGKIPGGFFKREGRPSEKEVLTSRLIDRPIRPLFPKGFYHEMQVIVTVLSLDQNIDPDIPAILAASAAITLSGVPFAGPIAAARVGYQNGQYLLNPTDKQLAASSLDLVVAGTQHGILMVESEAKELTEEVMQGALEFGEQKIQIALQAIQEFAQQAAKPKWDWQAPQLNADLINHIDAVKPALESAYQIREKALRQNAIRELRQQLVEKLSAADNGGFTAEMIIQAFEGLEKKIVRGQILAGQPRIDGRDTQSIRPISGEISVLPRTHGSALFTRGETQALVAATLGTGSDAQRIDALGGEVKDNFMLHYNFPPYSVGEVGQVGSPKRREIGHGRLAKRAIIAVLPNQDEFPYVLRVVSEITESNGSSSMASVCGTSLALMDAGVPIKASVAGIAMGLIKDGEKFAVLSDILGDEDHLGDMDFKVAGTEKGVTALQMDIKINGITQEIMRTALNQAKEGRLHILKIMNDIINKPKEDMSMYAPRIVTIKVHPDKVREIIGKGGSTIRSITEETGVTIDITDDGIVKIASCDNAASEEACRRINLITAEAEVGAIYEGTVMKLVEFGAFVNIMPGKDGLVHISQICAERVEDVREKLSEGQAVKVKVLEIDRQGKIRLTMKDIA